MAQAIGYLKGIRLPRGTNSAQKANNVSFEYGGGTIKVDAHSPEFSPPKKVRNSAESAASASVGPARKTPIRCRNGTAYTFHRTERRRAANRCSRRERQLAVMFAAMVTTGVAVLGEVALAKAFRAGKTLLAARPLGLAAAAKTFRGAIVLRKRE